MTSVEIVRNLCKERHVSIAKLERELGFANGYIGKLKKGTFPTDKAMAIANYFNVPIEYLQTGMEPTISTRVLDKFSFIMYLEAIGWDVLTDDDHYVLSNGFISVNVSYDDFSLFENEIRNDCIGKIRELIDKSVSDSLLPVAAHDNGATLEEIKEDMDKL